MAVGPNFSWDNRVKLLACLTLLSVVVNQSRTLF